MPWEMATPGLPGLDSCLVLRGERPASASHHAHPEPPAPQEDSTLTEEQQVIARTAIAAVRREAGRPPAEGDDLERGKALKKWNGLVLRMRDREALRTRVPREEVSLLVRESLEPKATMTILGRGRALEAYERHAEKQKTHPWPLVVDDVLDYLREGASVTKGAATRNKAFVEALGFADFHFTLDTDGVLGVRTAGLVAAGLKHKRETVQRAPFSVAFVLWLEKRMVEFAGGPSELLSLAEAHMVGAILFCVHCRLRFKDAARIKKEPKLDIVDDFGYIEASLVAGQHKTGHSTAKAGRVLPAVGHALGVRGRPWAQKWLELRRSAGLNAASDQCLFPQVLADGSFGRARMPTDEGKYWVLRLAGMAGEVGVDSLGTHSCKATMLSWCGKAGVEEKHCKLLGGHAEPGDLSRLEYSRDALAGPLRSLSKVQTWVKNGRFLPDQTRSGRWVGGEPKKKAVRAGASPAAPDPVEAWEGWKDEDVGSSDSEGAGPREDEKEIESEVEEVDGEATPLVALEGVTYLLNKVTNAVHVQGDTPGVSRCGFVFSAFRVEALTTIPSEARRCTRASCAEIFKSA